jgi:hypothetical protein
MKLYVYRLEDVEDDNFDNVKAVDVIEGTTNEECESKANNEYCTNNYGFTYCELPLS